MLTCTKWPHSCSAYFSVSRKSRVSNPFIKPEYLAQYGLKEAPYTTNPDERYLYLTDNHRDAADMCGHIIHNKLGAGLIVGEQGTGKTTILRRIASLMTAAPDFRVAIIETAEHSPTLYQLVKEILESFGVECYGRNTQTRIDQLKQFLLDTYKEKQVAVLLIDEAQQMRAKLLESLRGFLNFEDPRGGKLLQIILFAMPKIERRLRYAPSFRNRLVKTELSKMSRDDIEKMLRWRFVQAGGERIFPFEPSALNTLYAIANGNPRTVCGIAQLSLEVAASRNEAISPTIVEEVAERRYV